MSLKNISDTRSISLDNVCFLVESDFEMDLDGNHVQLDTRRLCYCAELPVTASEFFNAGIASLRPSCVLLVDSENYNDEKTIEYDYNAYDVYRNYKRSDGFTEIYMQVKVGDVNGVG